MEWLQTFNDNYANAIAALTPFVIGAVSWIYYSVYKESKTKNSDTVYVTPAFWSLRQKHRIDTLKRFKFAEGRKNYDEIETLYTPESWGEYIKVKHCCFRTEVVPKNASDILAVTIKRRPHENWKVIYFNR